MGFDFGVALPGGYNGIASLPGTTPSVMYSNVQCMGGEESIFDCYSMDINDASNTECCSSCLDKSVAVYCSRYC